MSVTDLDVLKAIPKLIGDPGMLDAMMWFSGREMERLVEEISHTCPQKDLRHPWPWYDSNCKGCLMLIDKFVKRFHLEMPYLLFGREAMRDHYIFTIERKIKPRPPQDFVDFGASI